MSFFLTGGQVGTGSGLIKAHEHAAFTDAVSLLEAAQRKAAAIDAEAEEARLTAQEQGFAEGLQDAKACIQSEITKLASAISTIRAEHEASVAEAAFAAVTAIIGTLDDSDIINRIVANQISARSDINDIRITVAPQMAKALQDEMAAHEGCEIVADPELDPTACRLTTGDGRIVADLSLQLETLRQRWGLDGRDGRDDA